MSCNILSPQAIKLNGANKAYGGGISQFSIALGGISSQTKASVTLVGPELDIPSSGDKVVVNIMGLNLNMQVGGFALSTSATSASQLQLTLYDNSNIYLDNNHIALKEEAPEGALPSNLHLLGRKVGTIPNATLNQFGIRTGNVDTQWGDVRNFFEAFTPWWSAGIDGWGAKVDTYVAANAGKTIWHVDGGYYVGKTLTDAIRNVLAPGAELVSGEFDFKGSFRDVVTAYCNATGLQAWWDLEKDQLVIKATRSFVNGLAKLNTIQASCEITSSSTTADFTTTFSKGAVGSLTSSYQAENQSSGGYKISRYLRASLLNPQFHYKACRYKDEDSGTGTGSKLTVLKLESEEVLIAIAAASLPSVYATYVTQSVLSDTPRPSVGGNVVEVFGTPLDVEAICAEMPTSYYITKEDAQGKVKDDKAKEVNAGIVWANEFTRDPGAWKYNSFLRDYYWADDDALNAVDAGGNVILAGEATCPARVVPVLAALTAPSQREPAVKDKAVVGIKSQLHQLANGKKDSNAKKENNGWNNDADNFPKDPLGDFNGGLNGPGQFGGGSKMFLLQEGWFDSILGKDAVEGAEDLLRMYLLAIYEFYQRFYVIKDNSTLRSARIEGQEYGYYLNSEAQGATQSLKAPEGYRLVSINPLLPVGECGFGPLENLVTTCAAMYMFKGENYTELLKNVAVIDFVYALEQGGRNPARGQKGGLQKFFENYNSVKMATPKRAVAEEFQDDPTLQMFLLTSDEEANDLEKAFIRPAVAGGFGQGDNFNIIAGSSTINQLEEDCEDACKKLPLSGNDVMKYFFLDDDQFSDADGWHDPIDQPQVELWAINGPDIGDKIDPAVMPGAEKETLKIWYDVSGSTNSISSEPNEWMITAAAAPKKGYWKSKMDYGLSLNAADVGMTNAIYQAWEADAGNEGNTYSISNRRSMRRALQKKVNKAASTDDMAASSTSISFIVSEDSSLALPTLDEGLESLQISSTAGKTVISITVGNTLQRQAMKAIYERMVQSPSTQYRPGSVMPDSFAQTSPRFQAGQRGLKIWP